MTDSTGAVAPAPHHPISEMPYLYLADPRDLVLRMDRRSRPFEDIETTHPVLYASVKQFGVNTPPTVHPDPDGGLFVGKGFHRTAAAKKIREEVDPDFRIWVMVSDPSYPRPEGWRLDQMRENIARKAYTTAELADNYEQLTLAGMDADTIAAELSTPVEEVTATLAVSASPRTRQVIDALPQLDVFTLATLAEFDDSPEAHADLVATLEDAPELFDHEVSRLRRERERGAMVRELEDELRQSGVEVVSVPLPDTVLPLEQLCGPEDDTPLSLEDHEDCAGRSALVAIDHGGAPSVVWMCRDYAAHGHRDRRAVQVEQTIAALQREGVTVVACPPPDGAERLVMLHASAEDRTVLTPATHATCPGHAASVEPPAYARATPYVTYVCTDPTGYGHVRAGAPQRGAEQTPAQQKANYDRTRKNNCAWRDALPVRRAWLNTVASWEKLPPGLTEKRVLALTVAARFVAGDRIGTALSRGSHYARTLLRLDAARGTISEAVTKKLDNATVARAKVIDLVSILAAFEERYDIQHTVDTWRSPDEADRFYFSMIATINQFIRAKGTSKNKSDKEVKRYALSKVERLVLDPLADAMDWPALFPVGAEDDVDGNDDGERSDQGAVPALSLVGGTDEAEEAVDEFDLVDDPDYALADATGEDVVEVEEDIDVGAGATGDGQPFEPAA